MPFSPRPNFLDYAQGVMRPAPPPEPPPTAPAPPSIVKQPLSKLYLVAFADSAGGRVTSGRKASQRSRSAIVVSGMDEMERHFCLKAWAQHCTTDELIEEIFATQEHWRPAVFGIDATGNQGLFADAIRREVREKNRKLPLTDFIFEGDKDWRIETTLQPLQAAGKLFSLTSLADLEDEYSAFPGGNYKDILDAWCGCIKLCPRKPKLAEARDELRQLREYLRSQRLPESQVQARVEQELLLRERSLTQGG